MSWFGRKQEAPRKADYDPRIDFAREALKDAQDRARKNGTRRERATGDPGVVDVDFCYGGDAGPCA